MGLSTNEVLLILRARDEATRTIGRVSGAMSRMDRDAVVSSRRMVEAQQRTLAGLQRQVGDVNSAYQRTTANLLNTHRQQMRAVKEQTMAISGGMREVNESYRDFNRQQRALVASGRLSGEQYKRNMAAASKLRDEQLRGLASERDAVYAVRDAHIASYHDQINAARQLHLTQQEQMRQARIQAEDAIQYHNQRMQQVEDEKRALRDHGNLLMANGAAVATFGAAITYMGVQGVKAYSSNIQAAMDYETAVARTFTQVDKGEASLNQIRRLGKEVADELPVAFEEIQPAIYDIFSSIDVGFRGARTLIKQFSKDAVAGTTSLEVAGRANLAIMNAYNVSAKDAADVSDFMFRLVQKGVGTYEEFAKTIGRAIPSAVRAGQTYETLGAMMAFLTRNGMSAAMAGTSAARAFDAISNAGTVAKLEDIGVKVKDVRGEFLPLVDILDQMADKMKGMKGPERAAWLQDLFTGTGGTIQARRFFDSYFKDAKQFNKLTKEMGDNAGIAGKKFEAMAESPQYKIEQLKNDWQLLRIELGEHLMPIAMAVVETLNQWIDAFDALDPDIKRTIAIIGAIIVVLTTLIGIVTVVVGAFMIFAGAAAAIGISLGAALGIVALVVAAFIALGGVAVYVYKHWDKFEPMFDKVMGWGNGFKDWLLNTLIPGMKDAWEKGKEYAQRFVDWFEQDVQPGLTDAYNTLKDDIEQALDDINEAWQDFKDDVDWEQISRDIEDVKNSIDTAAPQIVQTIQWLAAAVGMQMKTFATAVRIGAQLVRGVFEGVVGFLSEFIGGFVRMFQGFIKIVGGLFGAWSAVFRGDWRDLWQNIKQIADGGVDMIVGAFKVLVKAPYRLVRGFIEGIIGLFEELFDVLVGHSIVPDLIDRIVEEFMSLPGRTLGAVAGWVGSMIGKAADFASKFPSKIKSGIDQAVTKIGSLPGRALNAVGSTIDTLWQKGWDLVQGIINGIRDNIPNIPNPLDYLPGKGGARTSSEGSGGGGGGGGSWGSSEKVIAGLKPRLTWIQQQLKKLKDVKLTKDIKPIFRELYQGMIKDLGEDMPKMAGILDVAKDLIDKKLDNVAKGLKGDAKKAFDKARGGKAKSLLEGVRKATEDDLKRLQKVHTKLKKTLKDLEAARNRLQNLRQERKDYIQSTRDMLMDFGSFSSLEQPQDVFGNKEAWTAGSISSQLQEKLRQIKTFGKNLKALKKMGFTDAVIKQIIAMGIVDGSAVAEALLQATPTEMGEINSTVSQIGSMSSQIGEWAGNEFYNVGIQTAEGLVKGLESKAKDLREIARKLGIMIAQEIKKALKIKSPSKVGDSIAKNFGGTIADGLRGQTRNVAAAAKMLGEAMQPSVDEMYFETPKPPNGTPPVFGGGGQGPGGASSYGKQVTQNFTIYTQEIDPRKHAADLGWELANNYGEVD